jgi:hypothetical protein
VKAIAGGGFHSLALTSDTSAPDTTITSVSCLARLLECARSVRSAVETLLVLPAPQRRETCHRIKARARVLM